uniref:Cation-transporting P-type ATPase N-terminal domain-containing protein n=1 Tax=Chromera velia CCMP2878 TaxID=1169474 RepID=A0A0G4FY80_9ALVE|eukprot:Cvel_19364.t1-p1 / transcript=Cvel_19364.t1 / gene=Cvel_19364 / organism=Chromera_velia_CCMP2878 / gene_product=Calcium-transporting ATPase 3, putative / transcript_product=Calcium-transporting ATPase 3, putative / location=Cvel_scaffold1664:13220-20079(+) / protein_length=1069 / sequence_SO=supercontig / SO=protein_coding / is_pseudo=false
MSVSRKPPPGADDPNKTHLFAADDVYHAMGGTNCSTEQWVFQQRQKYGENKLKEAHGKSLLSVIFWNFVNPLTAILVAVLILACIIQEWIEAVVVVIVILLNAIVSIVQEWQSEQSMAAIRHLGGATNATVVRDGRKQQIALGDVVVGDIVELRQGDVVPADMRLMESNRLEVDEAVLTGESVPVQKTLPPLPAPAEGEFDVAVGDRTNMCFRQTNVSQGSGRGVVVSVGEKTEIGKIAEKLSEGGSKKKTALTLTMEYLMYFLLAVGVVFGLFIFTAFEWNITNQALLYASATLVAILPEAAIVLITVTMAISVRRMAASNAIVRNMTALEQLGKVTDICSDKTGTLTQGKMRPACLVLCQADGTPGQQLIPDGPAHNRRAVWSAPLNEFTGTNAETLREALRALVLCSTAKLVPVHGHTEADPDELEGTGSPTELALMEMAHKIVYGLKDASLPTCDSAHAHWEARGTFDFDSTTKTMSTGWHDPSTHSNLVTVKGAPETILPRCSNSPGQNAALVEMMETLAQKGLRVLAVAQRTDLPLPSPMDDITSKDRAEVEKDLKLLALVAIRDPPKDSSIIAVKKCFSAGIVVRMLTGDHPSTAEAIAKEIGIIPDFRGPAPKGMVMTGPVLDAMTDEELDAMKELPLIVARSSPASKVRMVEALHRRKKVVAMTGDGVNDSPAIKQADIGIAMGITGSDVTKGVADIVLADDNFATIVSAVQEGRRIFASISSFVMHLLSGNMAEAVTLLVSLAYAVDEKGIPVFVLSPIAILFVNTVTGSGPAIGIALDECPPDLMNRPPVHHGIFTFEAILDCTVYGFVMGGMTLLSFSVYLYEVEGKNLDGSDLPANCNTNEGENCGPIKLARGAAFLTLNTLLLVHAYNCRHQRLPFWKSPLNNRVLWGSVLGGTVIAVIVLYVPFINDQVFKHLGGSWEWGMVAGLSIVFMAVCELYKALKRATFPPLTALVDESTMIPKVIPAPPPTAALAPSPVVSPVADSRAPPPTGGPTLEEGLSPTAQSGGAVPIAEPPSVPVPVNPSPAPALTASEAAVNAVVEEVREGQEAAGGDAMV